MPRRLVVEAQRPEYLLPAYYLLRTNYRTNYLLTTSTYRLVVEAERSIEPTLTIAHERAVGRPHSIPGYPSTWQFFYTLAVFHISLLQGQLGVKVSVQLIHRLFLDCEMLTES